MMKYNKEESNSSFDFLPEDCKVGICPSCRFKLVVHSAKQIVSCALKEIRLVLGV